MGEANRLRVADPAQRGDEWSLRPQAERMIGSNPWEGITRQVKYGLTRNEQWQRRERRHDDRVRVAVYAKEWHKVARLVDEQDAYVASIRLKIREEEGKAPVPLVFMRVAAELDAAMGKESEASGESDAY